MINFIVLYFNFANFKGDFMPKIHVFLCALYSFDIFSSFSLDFDMNNDTQQFHRNLRECALLIFANARNKLLILVYAILIPLIIIANFLSIFGIIKTKRKKFTSSQILFLALFVSDLTIGVVQLPINIYLNWKASDQTCFEAQLGGFCTIFLICLSGTISCVISIDRYITVVHNKYHKRFVTRKLLTIIIICVTLTSLLWATLDAMFKGGLQIVKLAQLYIALSAYTGSILAISTVLKLALLKYVKITRKNSSIKQAQDSGLTKTIAIILAIAVVTYLPLVIFLNIAAYSFFNPKNIKFIQKIGNDFLWVLIFCQSNAILNSAVYLVRSSRTRRYIYKLFQVKKRREVRKCQPVVFNVIKDSASAATARKVEMLSVDILPIQRCCPQ